MHLVESLLRKLRAHSGHWSELPEVTVPSAAATDDDVEHWSDMRYMQELVDEIADAYMQFVKRIDDQPTVTDLSWALYLSNNAKMFPHLDLAFSEPWPVDEAGLLLAAWRQEMAA
jgi:hypothetical protein